MPRLTWESLFKELKKKALRGDRAYWFDDVVNYLKDHYRFKGFKRVPYPPGREAWDILHEDIDKQLERYYDMESWNTTTKRLNKALGLLKDKMLLPIPKKN